MHTAIRPYMTTGIAILGASVVAFAPVTVPPPDLRAAEVAVVDTMRPATADVELTALADALIAAFPQAVVETVQFWTMTIPNIAQNYIAAGKFAHLPVLAVNAVILGAVTPIAPFVHAVVNSLPLPLGTPDGLILETWKLLAEIPATGVNNILSVLAEVFDSGASPIAAFSDVIDTLAEGLTAVMESIADIVAVVSGAVPFKTIAASASLDSVRAVTAAAETDTAPLDSLNAVPASLDSSTLKDSSDTTTITVDVSASEKTEKASDSGTTEAAASHAESGEEEQKPVEDNLTPNGGTDLADGNKADPASTHDDSTSPENDGSTQATPDDSSVESATDTKTSPTTDSDSGSDSGSDKGAAHDGESSGEQN